MEKSRGMEFWEG